jgi:hypothetical protein
MVASKAPKGMNHDGGSILADQLLVQPHNHLPSTLLSRHGEDRNHHHVQGKRCFARGPSAPKSSCVE